MKYTDNAACAKKINTQFQRLRQHHSKMDKHLNSSNYAIISKNEINDWLYGADHNSPVLLLNTSIYNWENPDWQFVNRGLQREIDHNILTANEGYFEYIKNTFANQWHFVKQFDASISLYINHNDKAMSIYNKLHRPPEKFTKEEFRTAIEIDLISIFECAENLYLKYDKEYIRYFKESEFLRRRVTNPDFIQIDYGNANPKAVESLYKNLISFKFIDCTYPEFAPHFDRFATTIPDPIFWLGSNMQLMVLFIGKILEDENGRLRRYEISLKNRVDFNWLFKHFKFESDITTYRTLSASYSNALERVRIIDQKPVMAIIDDLDVL